MHPEARPDSKGVWPPKRSSILFVGARFRFCGKLISVVETDFAHVGVELIDDIDALCGKLSGNGIEAQLLIIDISQLAQFYQNRSLIVAAFPDKVIAIACDGGSTNSRESVRSLVESRIVRGVLPMNLQLDIWLSALQLMLNGGDYIPVDMMYGSSSIETKTSDADEIRLQVGQHTTSKSLTTKSLTDRNAQSIGGLTRREIDVLKLVAEGHQNKVIAARLKLSEHTVKLHMHHIITKLGAHNRTQAAAVYFGQLYRDT
jgi:DNA-binding NarL/FixJ family response regulator